MRWMSALFFCFCAMAAALEPNLLTNGGMESDADGDGVADGWVMEIHRHEGGEGALALDRHEKVKGNFSQRITHNSERGWVRISQVGIPANPNARYLFRCWVKADCRFLLIVYAFRDGDRYDTFMIAEGYGTGEGGRGTESEGNGWRLFSGVVSTPPDVRSFKVSLITDSRGTAWFDDAELILLERPPYMLVSTVGTPPKLDGDLFDACWQGVEPLMPFLELSTGKIAEPPTVARVVATPTNLFVAFQCFEPTPQKMRLRTPESGEPAYMDDCVEVYLDLTHSHQGFMQFVVTPKGNKWAQRVEQVQWAKVWWLLPRPTQRAITDGWQAAAKIGDNDWTAEVAIPLSLLGIQPQTGMVVGINLCRSRKARRGTGDGGQIEQNSAFVYLAEKTFQRPERFVHLVFSGIRDWGHGTRQSRRLKAVLWKQNLPRFVPQPQRVIWYHEPPVAIDRTATIVVPDGATALERTAAALLNDTFRREGFYTLPMRSVSEMSARYKTVPYILLTTLARVPEAIRPHLPVSKLRTFFSQRGEEAYVLFVGTGDGRRGTKKSLSLVPSVAVIGASARGVFNGVQTLRQIFGAATSHDRQILLPPCEIWDFPDLKLRGWHFFAPLRGELPFAERLLDFLALLKFNTLVIEVDDRFPYERCPDIAHPQALTKDEWRRFLNQALRLGFEVIPQVQTFGHFGYVLNKPTYRHLSENREPHPRWGYYAYCPSNPETYRVVFDMFDEVLEVFKPRWFHIGHDEIAFVPIGVCERCKGKPAWQLLADEVRKLYDYLKGKGVERVAMWCDQLEPDRTGGYVPYFTHFAADLIPKDIVQFCWHYDARQTFPWLTRLHDKGFDVVACGWYHSQNVWRFAAESFDRRTLGYCGTTWYGVTGFVTQVDLMTAVVLAAENAWSVDIPTIDKAVHPTNIAQDFWALVGERRKWRDGVGEFVWVDLSSFVNASLTQIIPDRLEWDEGRGTRDRVKRTTQTVQLGASIVWLEGVPFKLVGTANRPLPVVALSSDVTLHEVAPDLVVAPIGMKAQALYLLMVTTARPVRTEDLYGRGRTDPRKVATLIVRYADETEVRQDLQYRRHLTEWNDRLGCSHARIVWQGKTERGYLVTLCAYEWRNPKPEAPIASVMVQSAMLPVQPVLVALTVGINTGAPTGQSPVTRR